MLEFLVYVLLIWLAISLIFRFFGKQIFQWFIKKLIKKQMRRQGFDAPSERKKTGEVEVEFTTKAQKKSKEPVGEYIDYEEID